LVPKNHSTKHINQEESIMATAAKSGDKPPKPKTAAKPAVKTAAKTTTAKPAASKPAPKSAAKPAAAAKPAKAAAKKSGAAALTPEQRRCYVEVAAYYMAERRGFTGGNEMDDWMAAEAEIDRLLREGILKP
jgi:hypothetical protein